LIESFRLPVKIFKIRRSSRMLVGAATLSLRLNLNGGT
jgi:hypothetical protein